MDCRNRYGNPEEAGVWEGYLRAISPYHRLRDAAADGSGWAGCPRVLFTTSTKDDRVHPGHARKMVKALLDDVPPALGGGPGNVFYWENIEGGACTPRTHAVSHRCAHATPAVRRPRRRRRQQAACVHVGALVRLPLAGAQRPRASAAVPAEQALSSVEPEAVSNPASDWGVRSELYAIYLYFG